jgi:hypothetical protein
LLICPSGCFVAAARIDLSLRTPQSNFVGALTPSASAKRGPMNVTRHLHLPDSKRNCRLIVEPGRGIDLCSVDPGSTSEKCPKATSVRPQGLKICIHCGHLLNERLKSHDDFGCSLTVFSDKIEHLPDFFQIRLFSAQPV